MARIINGVALDLGALESRTARALLSMQRLATGEFKITLSGLAGNYRLDLSNDLKSWSESATRKTLREINRIAADTPCDRESRRHPRDDVRNLLRGQRVS